MVSTSDVGAGCSRRRTTPARPPHRGAVDFRPKDSVMDDDRLQASDHPHISTLASLARTGTSAPAIVNWRQPLTSDDLFAAVATLRGGACAATSRDSRAVTCRAHVRPDATRGIPFATRAIPSTTRGIPSATHVNRNAACAFRSATNALPSATQLLPATCTLARRPFGAPSGPRSSEGSLRVVSVVIIQL